jgi:hypothetical protein
MADDELTSPSDLTSDSLRELRAQRDGKRVEWLLGLAIAFLLAVAAVPGIQSTPQSELSDVTVRGLEGLLLLARDEAIRTGDDHIVFFEIDGPGGEVTNDRGVPVMALLIRDRDADGQPSDSEYVASVPLGSDGLVSWGSARATTPADGDAAQRLLGPWSFGESAGQPGRVPRLVYRSDGAPHAYTAESGTHGDAGSGAGSVYLYSASEDYAVVLSPWGDVDVQVWDPGSMSWRLASIR